MKAIAVGTGPHPAWCEVAGTNRCGYRSNVPSGTAVIPMSVAKYLLYIRTFMSIDGFLDMHTGDPLTCYFLPPYGKAIGEPINQWYRIKNLEYEMSMTEGHPNRFEIDGIRRRQTDHDRALLLLAETLMTSTHDLDAIIETMLSISREETP